MAPSLARRGPTWLSVPERGSALGIYFFLWTVTIFGRTLGRVVLWPVMLYYFVSSRRARRASRAFLQRTGHDASWRAVFGHLLRFGQVALDRLLFVQGKITGMTFDPGPVALLRELQDSPRGALLLGAHIGSFEAMGGMAREHRLDVTPVVDSSNSRVLMGVLERLNPELAARTIDLGRGRLDAIFEIRQRLERGEHVGLLADRCPPTERATTVPFMGQDADFPSGPYILAASLKCPVYFVAALYRGGSRYAIHAERFADQVDLPRKDRAAALRKWTRLYADKLEALARAEPTNWFNFYDFWQTTPRKDPRDAT